MEGAGIPELLQQVRRLRIVAGRKVSDLMAGGYHSVVKGRGMESEEVREYQPGDEIRDIDWNVTARSGAPFVKRFAEERELTVSFLVDVSASGVFGSQGRSKREILAEVVAVLMVTALRNQDKVGLSLFAGSVLRHLPPRKSRGAVLRCLRELLAARPVAEPGDPAAALDFLARVERRRGIVFLASDLLDATPESLLRSLRRARRRHEIVALQIVDPLEEALPAAGLLQVLDPETGRRAAADSASEAVRRAYEWRARERERTWKEVFARAGVDRLRLRAGEDTAAALTRFFEERRRRIR